MAATPRQTYSYLRELFIRHGVAPQRRLGQNFLIDLNIHDVIVRAAEITQEDVILEVGPGAGALTARMAPLAAAVVAVEVDPMMAELTREAVFEMPNVRVLRTDALAGKNRLNPEVLDHVRSGLAGAPGRRLKLVANLPYNIATPLISNLLVHPELYPSRIVATIQLELAERMVALAASGAYGGLSVLVQAVANAEIVRTLPPSVFWPRPKVESAIVRIDADTEKRAAIGDVPWFHSVVRRVFLHRRKNLRGVLLSEWRDRWPGGKPEIDALLAELGLAETGQIRAESMNVEEFQSLAEAMKRHFGETEAESEADDAVEDDEDPSGADSPDDAG